MDVHPIIDTQNYLLLDYNQRLKRLRTDLNGPSNQNSMQVPKVVKLKNKKTLLFGGYCNKQSIVPYLPCFLLQFSVLCLYVDFMKGFCYW